MTCVVGMVDGNGAIYLAGDVMASGEGQYKTVKEAKVFKKGEFLIGYTTSFRMGQILQYMWPEVLHLHGLSDDTFIKAVVINSIREAFLDNGFGCKDGVEEIGGNFVIGYRGVLYEVQEDFSVLTYDKPVAIGGGKDAAAGAMYIMSKMFDKAIPETMLSNAIEAAAATVVGVSKEYKLVTSKEG